MVELVMRKRAGRQGEYGLFVESPVFEEDFAHIKEGVEVKVVATTPRSLRQLKFAWALATKIAEACDWIDTKEEAMDVLLIEAKHFRRIYDYRRQKAILRPKPTNFGAMDGTEYTSLLKRIVYVATTVIVPGLDETALRAEIEAMIGPDVPEPARKRSPAKGRSSREEVVGIPETGTGQRDNLHHVAPVDSPPPEGRPEDNSGPAARAPQSERKEAGAVGGEGQEPVRSDDAKPATAAEYIARARAWIAKQPVDQKGFFDVALAFFDSAEQVQLRTACKLSVGEGRMLRRELLEHFQGAKV